MRLGSGLALLVIGAILAFAVDITLTSVDLNVVGYILMAAGVLVLVLHVILAVRGRSASITTETTIDPVTGDQVTRRVRRDDY